MPLPDLPIRIEEWPIQAGRKRYANRESLAFGTRNCARPGYPNAAGTRIPMEVDENEAAQLGRIVNEYPPVSTLGIVNSLFPPSGVAGDENSQLTFLTFPFPSLYLALIQMGLYQGSPPLRP